MATIRERLLAKKEQKDLEILSINKGQPKAPPPPPLLKADTSDEAAVLSRLMQMHRFAQKPPCNTAPSHVLTQDEATVLHYTGGFLP